MKRSDGSDWELGAGGFGRVFKALRNGAQPVAVKVLTVRSTRVCLLVGGGEDLPGWAAQRQAASPAAAQVPESGVASAPSHSHHHHPCSLAPKRATWL
jgi:hypothetical protein